MSLKEIIQNDVKKSMVEKDAIKVSVLRMVLASVSNREKDKRGKLFKQGEKDLEKSSLLTDEEVLEVLSSEVKKRRDSIEQFEKGSRQDLADKEKKELEILNVYLPEQMGEDEIRKIVKEKIVEIGISDPREMGKLMGALMPLVKGKADGKLVSKIVQEELNK
ncbi:GatB/YqeY domain-containing protein [Patescibacteria group bacterium]